MSAINNSLSSADLQNIIEQYLWFRYLPPEEFPEWLDSCITPYAQGKSYSIEETEQRIDQLFDKLLSDNKSKKHIVPISGGWDSRFILAALLDRLSTDQIVTYSFGSKGQMDYELGKKVAETAGVEHCAIDLKEFDFNWQLLVASAERAPWTHVPDEMFNFLSMKSVADEKDTIWSGFLGDPLTGSHLLADLDKSFDILKKEFAYNAKKGDSFKLTTKNFQPEKQFPDIPEHSKLYVDDALDLGIRQANCVAPIVLPVKQCQCWDAKVGETSFGSSVIAPFIDRNWAGFWLSAPRKVRRNQVLYLETLKNKYSRLFEIPNASDFGISDDHIFSKILIRKFYNLKKKVQTRYPWMRIRATKKLNYLDFDELFRTDQRYEETITHALELLKKNYSIDWLDLDQIWDEHYYRKKEHGLVLQMLLGLAANLDENIKE